MADLSKKLIADLVTIYNWGPEDICTLFARKVGQDRQLSVSDPVLYDGDDIQEEVRNYLRDLADV